MRVNNIEAPLYSQLGQYRTTSFAFATNHVPRNRNHARALWKGADWPESLLAQRIVKTSKDALDAGAQAAIICSPASFHLEQAMDWVVP